MIRFKVMEKQWTSLKSIVAEAMGMTAGPLLMQTLERNHGFTRQDFSTDPVIYFTVDSQQTDDLRKSGMKNPTYLQLLLSSRCFDLDKERCIERFKGMVEDEGGPSITLI